MLNSYILLVRKLLNKALHKQGLPSQRVADRGQVFTSLVGEETVYNLFLPSVKPESIFGGIFTALLFLKEIQDKNLKVQITTYDSYLSHSQKEKICEYLQNKINLKVTPKEVLTKSEFYHSRPSKNTQFIGTIWYTACDIRKMIQRNSFSQKSFFYLIQDFEPGFYNWSDDFAGAWSSYIGSDYIPIFNTSLLKDYFYSQVSIDHQHSFVLGPQVNSEKLKLPQNENSTKKLLFYGRPSTPRNLFETGIQGMVNWLDECQPNVEIFTAGESHGKISFKNYEIKSLGKMDADEYWENLATFDIGLSLMLSPHPSYPPLEMAKSGVVTVTNRFANKDLQELSQNFVTCLPSVDGVSEALKQAYEKSSDLASRVKAADFEIDPQALDMKSLVESLLKV